MGNAARAPKIIEMPLKRQADTYESYAPATLATESPAAIAARKLEALAQYHMALEEYAEALDAFKRLLKLVPARPDLLVQTVACMERLELWEEGAALLGPEVEEHPDWTEAALALGICRLHLNQADEALRVFQAVDARHPGSGVAREGIRAAQALLGPAQGRQRPEDWDAQLFDLAQAQEWERLVKACEPYLEEGEPKAHFYMGYALEQMGNLAFARKDYERCLEKDPGQREARFNLAGVLVRQGQFGEACDHLARLAGEDHEDRQVWWNYLLAAESSGRHGEAREAAQHLIQREGFTPELRFRLAFNGLECGYAEEAARQFELCLEQNDFWVEARINLCLALQRMGNLERARAIIEGVFREHPQNMTAAETLAAIAIDEGRLEEAISLHESLEGRGSAPAAISIRIAEAFDRQGEAKGALYYYEKALRAEPGQGHALLNLAALFEQSGEAAKAGQCRKLAVRVDPRVAAEYFG